jgi:hypothetical protein
VTRVDAIDLLSLSRDVARVDERIKAQAADPFAGRRHVATASTYRALAESAPPGYEALIRDALLRWVHELLQTRVGSDLEEDEAEALAKIDERFVGDPPRTYPEAHRALLTASTHVSAAIALARLAELAPPVAAVRKERRLRRFEVARRLGLAHPFALSLASSPVASLETAALALLDATDGIAEEVRRRQRAAAASDVIHAAFAREANEGWPAHLGARWLEDAFAALVARAFRAPQLPDALGGASFLRAAASWGRALRLAGTARSLPYVLARDPHAESAHRFGGVLARAVADPLFQKKRLGVSARAAAAQSRALRASLLTAARIAAVRFLLASAETTDAPTFEELTARAFGAPLPRALRDAWPAPRADEATRLAGLLATEAFERDLVHRFDEDWFANPRTGAHLAAIAAAPVFSGDPPDASAPSAIGRSFERFLG